MFFISLMLISCTKDYGNIDNGCKCGKITAHEFTNNEDEYYFWIEVENNCTGNLKNIILDEVEFSSTHVNNSICLSEAW